MENKYKLIVDTISDGVQEIDNEGKIIFANRSYHEMLGYEDGELIGCSIFQIETNDVDRQKLLNYFKFLISEKPKPESYFSKLQKKNGEILDVRGDWNYKVNDDNKVVGFLMILKDVSDRKHLECQIKESEDYFKALIENSVDAISVINDKGENIYQSRAFSKMMGYETTERVGKNAFEYMHPDDKQRIVFHFVSALTKPGVIEHINFRAFHCDGTIRYLEGTAKNMLENSAVKGIVVNYRDITARKLAEEENDKLQEQLAQSRKMEAIGQLAGGVAHDFNNTLAGIIGAAQLLKSPKRNIDEKSMKYVDMILKSVNRAADLTAKLLAFGRKGKMDSTVIDVHKIIDDTIAIFNGTIDKNININVRNKAKSSNIVGDDSGLQNAFMNLGINASQAMPNGGEILIKTDNVFLNESFCEESSFDIEDGNYIQVEVQDTGIGISSDNIKQIFEPFFSTKKDGMGTGLGLSAVYGMVQDHHGLVKVSSKVGVGTSFFILLPVTENILEIKGSSGIIQSGSGQILLVDDDELIRVTGKHMLEEMGYEVILAEDGGLAVDIFKKNFENIDVVIMDMIMPSMNGREAFNEMKKIDVNCRIIISSGFTKEENLDSLRDNGLNGFIHKPFKDVELSKLLIDVLEGGSL